MALQTPAPIETAPLHFVDIPQPVPAPGEILVRIAVCGVCRTDLHVAEGDLPPKREHVVPGHEIVGTVEARGEGSRRFSRGDRVGVAWLRATDQSCSYCRSGRENLCPNARFTGWDHDGGYAEFAVVREDYAYALPDAIDNQSAAPLLCAGIIGYRAIKRAAVEPGAAVGLYGFGGSAHLAMQVLKHWGCTVFVMSRGGIHRELAQELGADWIGDASERPPVLLDAAVLFAPAGALVPLAMESLNSGGILAVAGIYLTDIPPLNYDRTLFRERELRSVTANTRADGQEFLELAAAIPVRTTTIAMDLEDANRALQMLKHDELRGAAVLAVS